MFAKWIKCCPQKEKIINDKKEKNINRIYKAKDENVF